MNKHSLGFLYHSGATGFRHMFNLIGSLLFVKVKALFHRAEKIKQKTQVIYMKKFYNWSLVPFQTKVSFYKKKKMNNEYFLNFNNKTYNNHYFYVISH